MDASTNKKKCLKDNIEQTTTKNRISLEQIEQNNLKKSYQSNQPNPNLNSINQPMANNPDKFSTLEYYKFLLYSLKFEIKTFEFFDLIRVSSIAEVFFWLVSIITSFILPLAKVQSEDNFQTLVLVQIFHILRAFFGFVLLCRIPKSYELLEKINSSISSSDLKSKSYNEIMKDLGRDDIIPRLESNKPFFIIYFILTFLVISIDIVGFFYILIRYGDTRFEAAVIALIITFIFIRNI